MHESDVVTTRFMIMFVCLGLLLSAVSVPLIRRQVKPNHWYGFRTPKTLASERVWYEANAYSGRLFCVLGVTLATGCAALRFVPRIGTSLETYSTVCGVMFTVGMLGVVAVSLRFLGKL